MFTRVCAGMIDGLSQRWNNDIRTEAQDSQQVDGRQRGQRIQAFQERYQHRNGIGVGGYVGRPEQRMLDGVAELGIAVDVREACQQRHDRVVSYGPQSYYGTLRHRRMQRIVDQSCQLRRSGSRSRPESLKGIDRSFSAQQQVGMSSIYIGTSGWSYKSWEKTFYPNPVPSVRQLEFYATQFRTVEINATFYRLPTEKMVLGWRDRAPKGFVYAVKGSRYITHMKKLANLDGALKKFFDRIEPMEKRIGCILWQLPPFQQRDDQKLDKFLRQLPRQYRHAVEFRHVSWLDEQVFDILREHATAHVSVSSLGMPANFMVTSEIVYIRFHGLAGGAAHDYTRRELEPWAEHIRRESDEGRTVYAYFNNDANVRAPNNAKVLIAVTQPETAERRAARPGKGWGRLVPRASSSRL